MHMKYIMKARARDTSNYLNIEQQMLMFVGSMLVVRCWHFIFCCFIAIFPLYKSRYETKLTNEIQMQCPTPSTHSLLFTDVCGTSHICVGIKLIIIFFLFYSILRSVVYYKPLCNCCLICRTEEKKKNWKRNKERTIGKLFSSCKVFCGSELEAERKNTIIILLKHNEIWFYVQCSKAPKFPKYYSIFRKWYFGNW